ncbi:tRNA pseudouridine(13) synthase TruD [Nonomuraea sp. WAC 01424]|uniref:tRNA pseudouridine(13) synthase TruD n=1 Tax=Nonomuraea sp. WAC 01424 TaxID=2203200 RepID=UPI000F7B21F5|nr:tRNA pseudouridine(13) synthase TruD [Nonomuraea sp. WAC 01424]RSN09173.1 tRNA pseudouridine(13) synthase TruD [Nonomuraea sp. WAC 01424]
MNRFEVKHVPEDFLVRECVAVRLVQQEVATHQFWLLRKCGYTTMEAVRGIADELGVPEGSVGYCGLKDEDGVTEQLISIPITIPVDAVKRLEVREGSRWYYVQPYGFGDAALRVGQMEGNSFKIILRNLEGRHLDGFFARKKINFMFLNYFDTQRFGVPGGPHHSHLVGAAMTNGDWDDARQKLIELNSPESRLAANWSGASRDFFFQLDGRVRSFFPAAYASFMWNNELAGLVDATAMEGIHRMTVDGIDFTYLDDTSATAGVLSARYELPIKRYSFEDHAVARSASVRATVAQTVIEVAGRADDEYFQGRKRVELSFFLPSGSYATAAVRQLALQIA